MKILKHITKIESNNFFNISNISLYLKRKREDTLNFIIDKIKFHNSSHYDKEQYKNLIKNLSNKKIGLNIYKYEDSKILSLKSSIEDIRFNIEDEFSDSNDLIDNLTNYYTILDTSKKLIDLKDSYSENLIQSFYLSLSNYSFLYTNQIEKILNIFITYLDYDDGIEAIKDKMKLLPNNIRKTLYIILENRETTDYIRKIFEPKLIEKIRNYDNNEKQILLKNIMPEYEFSFETEKMLRLSKIVYKDKETVKKFCLYSDYNILAYLGNENIDDIYNNKSKKNNKAYILEDKTTGEISFIVKGTNSMNDLLEDSKILLNSPEQYYLELAEFYHNFKKEYEEINNKPLKNVNFAGHSLGGTLANMLGIANLEDVNKIYNISGPGVLEYALDKRKKVRAEPLFQDFLDNILNEEALPKIINRSIILSRNATFRKNIGDFIADFNTHIGYKFKLHNEFQKKFKLFGHFIDDSIKKYNDTIFLNRTQSNNYNLNESDLMHISKNEENAFEYEKLNNDMKSLYIVTDKEREHFFSKKEYVILNINKITDLSLEELRDKNPEINILKITNHKYMILNDNNSPYKLKYINKDNQNCEVSLHQLEYEYLSNDKYINIYNKKMIDAMSSLSEIEEYQKIMEYTIMNQFLELNEYDIEELLDMTNINEILYNLNYFLDNGIIFIGDSNKINYEKEFNILNTLFDTLTTELNNDKNIESSIKL